MSHRVRYWLNGRRRQRSFTRKADAEKFKIEIKRKREAARAGIPYIDEDMKLKDAYRIWINGRVGKRPESTWSSDKLRFEKYVLPKFGNDPFVKIRTGKWQEFLDELGESLSNGTINRVRSLMSKFYSDLIIMELTTYNPIKSTERLYEPKLHNVDGYFKTDADIEEYLSRMTNKGPHISRFAFLMVYLGMRPSEAVALRWEDVDFQKHRVFIRRIVEQVSGEYVMRTKGKKSRVVPLFPELYEKLESEKASSGLVTLKPDGTKLSLYQAKWHHKDAVKDWRPDVTPKGVRVTFTNRMARLGFNTKDVQAMLGHATIITTERYMRTDDEDLVNKMKDLCKTNRHK